MKTILLATRNRKKGAELLGLLGAGWQVRVLADVEGLPDVVEDGETFEENAVKKAVQISLCQPGLVLADDSGLEVEALGNAPGIYSARYAGVHGDDVANNAKLLETLAGVPGDRRGARFRCSLAVAEGGRVLFQADGICQGRIISEGKGGGGFGYDPIFVPVGHDQTFAELSAETKSQISHRAHAMRQLTEWLASVQ